MDTQIVWKGHNNRIRLQLKASSSAVSLASVTKITLTFGSTLISNSSAASGAIIWSGASFSTGEVQLVLGSQTISAGKYDAPLIVYDAANTNGIVWDKIPIRVYDDEEAS